MSNRDARWTSALFVLLIAACNPSRPVSTDAGAGTADAAVEPVHATPAARRLVDAATVRRCTLRYHCGLSHPGLGSSSDEVSVDLAACTKTLARSRGPYAKNDAPPPRPPRPPPPPPSKTKLAPATCGQLEKLATEITDVDAREAQESARMDTTACRLSVSCPDELISVQRQSLSGASRVEKLIVAIQVAR